MMPASHSGFYAWIIGKSLLSYFNVSTTMLFAGSFTVRWPFFTFASLNATGFTASGWSKEL